MDDFLNMLSSKEIEKMSEELETLSDRATKTGDLMKDALDMSGSAEMLEKYSTILENDVNRTFDKIFGTQRKVLSVEQQRLKIIEATAEAIRSGDDAQKDSLKTLLSLSKVLDKVKTSTPTAQDKTSGAVNKAHGALSLMSGVLPMGGGGATRALNLGMGANNLMGGGMGLGKMGMIGGGLAVAGYGASRLMGGYQTYKQQAGDVLTGYGKVGRPAMGEIDLYGSEQGYSSLDRARAVSGLSEGLKSGVSGTDAGKRVSAMMKQSESQARSYGLSTQQTGGAISQLEQISGKGGALTERMMAEAVAAGVNRARISTFMEKSLHLTEQVYQATGKDDATSINSLLAQVVKNADDKTYAERYTAQTMGQIGEGIKSVGMGGGDLATQGFLSRAFAKKTGDGEGEQLSRYDFMARAQEGASGRNIRSVIDQSKEEFTSDKQADVAMSQMFGINFKQMGSLRTGLESGKIKESEVEGIIAKNKKDNYVENSAEGSFMKSISDNTSEQAKIGQKMLPLATSMVKLQTHIDQGIYAVLDFMGIKDPYEEEKKKELDIERKSSHVEASFKTEAKYGGEKERKALSAYEAIDTQLDDKTLKKEQVADLEEWGMSKIGKISSLVSERGKAMKGGETGKRMALSENISVEMEKAKGFTTRLLEEKSATKDPEVAKQISALIDKMNEAFGKAKEGIDKQREAMTPLYESKGQVKISDLSEAIAKVFEAGKTSAAVYGPHINTGR